MEMPAELETSSAASGDASVSSSGNQHHLTPLPPPPPSTKKKRNLPGMPDPDAEVIALSPKTLMATNRFVCEICNKGFQRDQNLQLHRRGHNLPWKLRQRSSKEVKKRVYVCPEPSCVHHDPSRALGDLTGIKKHFCRKHGEKRWKCDKCSKKYAVQSDWKAHSKTCGTREYRCDCGNLFSRRDSFITHRAFCDALAEESARAQSAVVAAPVDTAASGEDQKLKSNEVVPAPAPAALEQPCSTFTNLITAMAHSERPAATMGSSTVPPQPEPTSLCLSSSNNTITNNSLFSSTRHFAPPPPSPHMSATALLQKAAQMGSAATNASFLRGLGLTSSSTSPQDQSLQENHLHWLEPPGSGLGLGLGFETAGVGGGGGLPDLMMGHSSLFGPKPATLDLLGLGMGGGGSVGAVGGFSALMSSIGGGLDVAAAAAASAAASFGGGEDMNGQ
ncbi:Zinc finger protein MAGPIE [Acorus gramineus]|uniref:Protein EARLY HEADING DATE 2 n=1 Tax=Acorus gramineus TaxID=55184 RepID=A0AAV9BGJ9_ACOGR|nr:Zinc finger protein MAGPIE [Acorus gramineus]